MGEDRRRLDRHRHPAAIPRWGGRPDLHRPHAALPDREHAADARQRAPGDRGLDRYRKLEPFVTALPVGTTINLCTASPELLDALVAGRRQFTLARENTAETRKQRCFPTIDDYKSGLSNDQTQELVQGKVIDQTSAYFRSTIWVTIGTTEFTLYSLLYRSGNNGLVRPILRSHGTP